LKQSIIASCVLGFAVLAWPAAGIASPMGGETMAGLKAERILVKKSERRMYLLAAEHVIKEFSISLGPNPEGHKFFSGDGRTPEGTYYIEYKNPSSRFYRSLKISYPNAADLETSRGYGLPAGGMIMIHGLPTDPITGHVRWRNADWTEGCIAVTNSEMDEIWAAVEPGTVIEIQP
jgi:murein L,D-transpeptidase YafK